MLILATLVACSRPAPAPRVIFIGLDGADWRHLDPFMTDGTMPELARIVARGERRVLLTQHPPLSPLVWTTMMTGVSPLEHRILDFTRFSPRTREQEPITADERAVPAIWNMARVGGKRAAVFGMWATYPPEPGIVLTDRDLPRDYVEATNVVHARAMEVIRKEKPDLAILYFQGTDEIGHFTSGNVEQSRDYFRRIDAILGEYRALADDLGAQLVIASDHGFDWGGTHAESSTATATAAKWHRDEGVWLRYPREPAQLAPMRVTEVCGELLGMLGLPRMDYRRYYQRPAPGVAQTSEQIAKLKALGYIGSTAAAPAHATSTRTPQSFNNEGLLLRDAKRVDEAQRAFAEALRIDPKYASARQNLDDLLSVRGMQRLRARDCRGALSDFRAIARETALGWAAIAAAEGCLGDERAAAEAFAHAQRLDPTIAVP